MFRNALKFFLRLGCLALLGCFFAGCGIKGPLHLPQQDKTAPAKSAPAETAPAPAPQDTTK